jgi:hypothetical protein
VLRRSIAYRRAGDDQARAGNREAAVDAQAEVAFAFSLRARAGRVLEVAKQRWNPLSGGRGDPKERRIGKSRGRKEPLNLDGHVVDAALRHAVGLGQRHRAARDMEELEDRQVLARLRHRAVVGRDHQQHKVDAGHAAQHVVDEPLVARHVDEADRAAVREPQVDRHAAALFLRQPIGVDAGEAAHEARLAVVDVACGGDDHRRSSWAVNRASSSRPRRSRMNAPS